MQKWTRSRDETIQALKVQRRALRASAQGYDNGDKWEAVRLATAVYTIVHDGSGRSKSLLTQLGLRASLRFISRSRENPHNLLPESPFVIARVSSDHCEFLPAMGQGSFPVHQVQFRTWWTGEIAYRSDQFRVSRRQLVFALRNKDGGAHVDAELDDVGYLLMSRPSPVSWIFERDGHEPEAVLGMELASMRHIAWELERTLEQLPDEFQ